LNVFGFVISKKKKFFYEVSRLLAHSLITLITSWKLYGQFKDGKKHGRGTYNLANGNKYVGDWVEDSIEDEGVYTWFDGDLGMHRTRTSVRSSDRTVWVRVRVRVRVLFNIVEISVKGL
jgi:hypothetical protein